MKRLLSLFLCFAMIFNISSSLRVNADDASYKIITTLNMNVGDTKNLSITDSNGNPISVTWTSSDSSVISVSSAGVVKGLKAGTAYAITTWNGKSYAAKIVVSQKSSSSSTNSGTSTNTNTGTSSKTSTKTSTGKKPYLSKKSVTMTKGSKCKLKLINAKASKIKWSSSKKSVASVSKKGVVKAKKNGKAVITAKYKKKKYKCKVTVKKNSMTTKQAFESLKNYLIKNGKHRVTAYQNADGDIYEVSWSRGGINYILNYQSVPNVIFFYGSSVTEITSLSSDLIITDGNKFSSTFIYASKENPSKDYSMRLQYTKKDFILDHMPAFTHDSGDNTKPDMQNINAQATLAWMFPDFNNYITKKAGISAKQLGFKKWDNK